MPSDEYAPPGFEAVRSMLPWPSAPPYQPHPQGPLALAAGGPGKYERYDGRWLVIQELQRLQQERAGRSSRVLLIEAGVFLGGSLERWLVGTPDVYVVGIDLFTNVTDWVDRLTMSDQRLAPFRSLLPQLAVEDGSLLAVQSNLWRFRERTALKRGSSPQALLELNRLGLRPDVVFLDNDKSMHDLWVAHALWPHAVLAGDDWGHQSFFEQRSPVGGRPDVKKARFNVTNDAAVNVCAFAQKMGVWVSARSLTWVLHKLPVPPGLKDACAPHQSSLRDGGSRAGGDAAWTKARRRRAGGHGGRRHRQSGN